MSKNFNSWDSLLLFCACHYTCIYLYYSTCNNFFIIFHRLPCDDISIAILGFSHIPSYKVLHKLKSAVVEGSYGGVKLKTIKFQITVFKEGYTK